MNIDRIFFQTLKTITSSLVAQNVDRTWDRTNDEGHPKKGEKSDDDTQDRNTRRAR